DHEVDTTCLKGKQILIVTASQTSRKIWQQLVTHWGMTPVTAGSVEEVGSHLKAHTQFEVGILDHQMPDTDGINLAAQCRTHPAFQNFPLILFSMAGVEVDRTAYQQNGFVTTLNKPVKPAVLAEALVQVLSSRTPRPPKSVEVQTRPSLSSSQPLKILLAEDNVINQRVILRILEKIGFQAAVATNGYEVLEALRQQSFDLILMDIQMPEMDGLEATRRIIAEWPSDQRPKIIALTANAIQGDRETYLEAGMDGYLSKPINIDLLQDTIQALLKPVVSSQ
ncbi:MAG TPA: response regulator, partial [Acidobacteriota bacterium]|nr:response regulator [Acidobacteriota bacterium]